MDNLIDESLLETDHKGNYWLHPLVQEFAYDDLKNKTEIHKLAMEYYLSIPISDKPAKKENIQPLIEAHHHACMAKEYDEAFDIIIKNKLDKLLDLWGNYTALIDLCLKTLANDNFSTKTILKNVVANGLILGDLGTAYNIGDLRKAIEYYEQALKIAQKTWNRH